MSYKKLSSIGAEQFSYSNKFEIKVPEILTKSDRDEFLSSYTICVIDVYATWCGPCKITAPQYTELFKNYNLAGVVGLAKENVELNLSPNVQVIPTFLFYVNKNLQDVVVGADMKMIENKLIEMIKQFGKLDNDKKEKDRD